MLTPFNMLSTTQSVELVPDAMAGLTLAPDFLVKRIVGKLSFSPQSGATATTTIGLAIARSVHGITGSLETVIDPLSTDVDAGSQDILWQDQFQPEYGGGLDATGLDFSFAVMIDLRSKTSLRKLDKRHGIQLFHRVETAARIQMTFRLRVLGALSI